MILTGDALTCLRAVEPDSVQCCVTSPPYYGLRDYGTEGQIGLEGTPKEYIARLVAVFEEVRRVLTRDGVAFVNLGDSYAANRSYQVSPTKWETLEQGQSSKVPDGMKQKDRLGIPHMFAFAMRDAGWYWRDEIVWAKPNPMPESVTDRCTKSHEMIFMFSKSNKYYYDAEAIADPCSDNPVSAARREREDNGLTGAKDMHGNPYGQSGKGRKRPNGGASFGKQKHDTDGTLAHSRTYERPVYETRNRRSVWTITPESYHGAHFAVMPTKLVEPCILAGSRVGDIILDPFAGSGTTLAVAKELNRRFIGCELNPEYIRLIQDRLSLVTPALF